MREFPEWDDEGWKKLKTRMPPSEEEFRRFVYLQNYIIRSLLATINTLTQKVP